jgi:2-C-methyl-D-erythritol 4-phosphate cytidylyltransferase
MNIALITAGGVGNRMGQDIPKQFMTIFEKPVIIYTLERFQKHNEIDAIAVVCLPGWEMILQSYANQYGISKLKWRFPGGASNQESIYNGLMGLKNANCSDEDIIIVHDGVRPLISSEIISNNIKTCKDYGYAVTGLVCKEVIMKIVDNCLLQQIDTPREQLIRTQTPHTYRLKTLLDAHAQSKEQGLSDTVAPCDMIGKLGYKNQHLVMGSEKNGLKLTRPQDVDIFKAMVELENITRNHRY